ncbi:unnamed protein product, partial [Ectocarpus sp. 4 AP-2014]
DKVVQAIKTEILPILLPKSVVSLSRHAPTCLFSSLLCSLAATMYRRCGAKCGSTGWKPGPRQREGRQPANIKVLPARIRDLPSLPSLTSQRYRKVASQRTGVRSIFS